jgi:WD40 repeat protein
MEMKMGRESAILDGDGSAVIHVSITADGRRMLVQTRSGRISVYETANAERTHIWQLPPDTRTISAEFTTNNNIAFASTNNTVRTIALSEKDLWQSLMLPKVELTDALLCQNDQILICGDSSGRLINVTTKTGLVTPPVQCHRRRIHNIRQHPQNPRFVTMASWDNTASIVDIASLEPVMMFAGHADRVRDAIISPNGLVMVTVADDRTCRFWDARTGKSLHVSTLPERPLAIETCTGLSAAVVDVSGNRLSIQRGKVKPVSVVKGRFATQLTNVIGNSRSVTYLDGCRVVTLDSSNKRFKEFMSSDRITAASSHESAPILALGTSTGLIQILESSSLTHLLDMKCTNCQIASVGYSKSGDFMYAIGVDGQLNYLRLQGPKR